MNSGGSGSQSPGGEDLELYGIFPFTSDLEFDILYVISVLIQGFLELLGISKDATQDQIKKAYRKVRTLPISITTMISCVFIYSPILFRHHLWLFCRLSPLACSAWPNTNIPCLHIGSSSTPSRQSTRRSTYRIRSQVQGSHPSV
jgi:hypothetical protein